jgi:hypothetical protein
MKTNKNITLDTEIVGKLRKVECASALIEQLLREHFENNKPNIEKIKQKRAELSDKRREIRNLKAEIKQINAVSLVENKILNMKTDLDIKKEANLWYYGHEFKKNRAELFKSKFKDIIEFYKFKKGVE